MTRVDLGVAVLLEGEVAVAVQALRRALGDPGLDQIAPHVTLVPPLPLRPDELDLARARLVGAATTTGPFTVHLGPPATFWPVSNTVHLPVQDPDGRLSALREQVFQPPLQRRTHPFVAHVTLLPRTDEATIEAACRLLAGFEATLEVERLSLLRLRHEPRRWEVAFDVDLDGVRVLGGGPLALELVAGTVAEPDALALLAEDERPAGAADALVVTARREGAVVGAAWGELSHGLVALVVAPAARREGIGTQLRREWEFRAERRRARRRPGSSPR